MSTEKRYLDHNHVRVFVERITMQMHRENWKPDYIVGLTRGGLIPAVYISHYLNIPMHALGVSLRDNDGNGLESNCWMAEDAFKGKKILVVDDINDTGATLNWIVKDWQTSCLPGDERWDLVWNQNVKFAVLIDNLSSEFDLGIDYCGEEINKAEKDVWIVYPWER